MKLTDELVNGGCDFVLGEKREKGLNGKRVERRWRGRVVKSDMSLRGSLWTIFGKSVK